MYLLTTMLMLNPRRSGYLGLVIPHRVHHIASKPSHVYNSS
jgi:hypothetical protein